MSDQPAPVIEDNLQVVRQLERRASERRSFGERLSDGIVRVVGTAAFAGFHLLGFGLWVAVNLGWIPPVPAFDPFPFGILTLIVSAEGVLLSLFILISQNRMMRDADRRAQLDLQMSLLTEQSSTKLLNVLHRVAEHVGVKGTFDAEAAGLAQRTSVDELAVALEKTSERT